MNTDLNASNRWHANVFGLCDHCGKDAPCNEAECLIDGAIGYAKASGYKIGKGSDGLYNIGGEWLVDPEETLCPLSAVVIFKRTLPTNHKAAVCEALNKPWSWVKAWVDGFDGTPYTVGDRAAYDLGCAYGSAY